MKIIQTQSFCNLKFSQEQHGDFDIINLQRRINDTDSEIQQLQQQLGNLSPDDPEYQKINQEIMTLYDRRTSFQQQLNQTRQEKRKEEHE